MRLAYYQAANVARRHDPGLAAHYRKLMVERHHNHISANTAVARKLACRAWAVLDSGQPYHLRDLDGSPLDADQAKAICATLAVPTDVRQRTRAHQQHGRLSPTDRKNNLSRRQPGRVNRWGSPASEAWAGSPLAGDIGVPTDPPGGPPGLSPARNPSPKRHSSPANIAECTQHQCRQTALNPASYRFHALTLGAGAALGDTEKIRSEGVQPADRGSRHNPLVGSWTQDWTQRVRAGVRWTPEGMVGMAENVGRRGDSWFFRIDLPPGPDGKRRQRRASGFASERAARRALAQTKVDIDAGRLRHGPRRTVADLAAEWLEAVQPNRKASTFSNYGWLMRAYVVPRIGRVRLDRLSPADVQKLYSELRASGGREGTPLTGTQVRNIHRVLHNALNYAVRLGYIARNPTEAVDKPREDTEERTVYTPEQIRRFLAAVDGDRLQAMWYLVLGDRIATGGTGRIAMAGRGPRPGAADPGGAHDADHRRASGGRARSQEQIQPEGAAP